MPWLKYQASGDTPAQAPWLKYQATDNPPSSLMSGLRGAAQGASLGFEDELAGAGGVVGDQLGKLGVDPVQSTHPDVQAKLDAIAQGGPSVRDIYAKSRDEERASNAAAEKAHPALYLGGNLAGTVATLPTLGLKGAIGAGAAMGLGGGDSDLTQGNIGGAAVDTAVGAAGGGLGYSVGQAVPKLWNGVKYFGKKALTSFGPTMEAIDARLGGAAQDTAKSYPKLAEDMGDTLKNLGKQTSDLDTEAWNTLSTEPTIPKVTVTHSIDQAISDLGVQGKTIGPTDKQVSKVLGGLKKDLGGLSDDISESDLKAIVKKLDDNINWDDQSQDKLNTVLEGIRTKFDQQLKFQNSNYAKAMEPVSERTALLKDLKRQFNFKGVPGEGLQPSDATASSIQSSLRENKAVTQGNLEKLKQLTGDDYSGMANDYKLSQQFDVKPPQASTKKSFIGGALGSAIGSFIAPGAGTAIGAGVGAAAGGAMDAYGGKAMGHLIDTYLKAGNSAAFGKFAPVIAQAAAKGPQALAILGSVLGNNLDFKKQMGLDNPDIPQGQRSLGSH